MKGGHLVVWLLACALLALAGCGDDHGSSGVVGVAVDPYIVEARFQEILADGTEGQLSTFSGEDGTFVFAAPLAPDSTVRMVVAGTHNGIPFEGEMKTDLSLGGETLVLSPLTTLLVNLMESDPSLGPEDAIDTVTGMFADAGLELAAEDLLVDPMGDLSRDANFGRLEAAMATNAFFLAFGKAGQDGYYLTEEGGYLAHLERHQEVLTNMVAAIRSSLRQERRELIRELAGTGLPAGYDVADEDLVHAAVAAMEYVAEQVAADLREDGDLDLDPAALVSEETLAELALNNCIARCIDDPAFVDAAEAEGVDLPAVEAGATFSLDPDGAVQTASVPGNTPPVADAGDDQSGETGVAVQLDGSGSDDPDGDLLGYRWTFVRVPGGSAVDDSALSDPTAVDPSFVPDLGGTYELRLIVNDGELDSRPSLVDIDVIATNAPPVADAGADQTVRKGVWSYYEAFLDGSASRDPDGDPLSYSWSFVSVPFGSVVDALSLSDPFAVDPWFEPDVEGVYVLQLMVNDGELDSAPDEMTVTAPPLCEPHDMMCGF